MIAATDSRRSLHQKSSIPRALSGDQSSDAPRPNAGAAQPELAPPEGSAQQQQDPDLALREVGNAEQLVDAVAEGAIHILITAHMDLHHLVTTRPLVIVYTETIRVCLAAFRFTPL